MAKTKEKALVNAELLRPYVQRAMTDPELRQDLVSAFVTARTLYGQLGKGKKGVKDRVSDKDFQKDLQGLVAELTTASGKLSGKAKKKSHKARNRVVLLTGMTLGLLYNPWTGQATRGWIMDRVSGSDGIDVDDLHQLDSDIESDLATAGGNGAEA